MRGGRSTWERGVDVGDNEAKGSAVAEVAVDLVLGGTGIDG
jgi:hypothetical protein